MEEKLKCKCGWQGYGTECELKRLVHIVEIKTNLMNFGVGKNGIIGLVLNVNLKSNN